MTCNDTDSKGPRWLRLDIKSALLVLAFIGAAVSVELTIVHQRAYQNRKSGCDISSHVSCSKVARTPQSEVLGVPISVWGLCAYGAFALLAVWGMACPEHDQWPWGLVFAMALGSVLYSVYLAYVAYIKYELVCLWCTALYGVNLGLLLVGAVALVRAKTSPWKAFWVDMKALWSRPLLSSSLAGIAAAVAIGLILFFPKPDSRLRAAQVDIARQVTVDPSQSGRASSKRKASFGPATVAMGKDKIPVPLRDLVDADTPSRGPVHAEVYVVELSDYECPFCGAAHKNLRKAFRKYAGRMRLFHRHFPLDQACNPLLDRPFHPHSCAAAKAAICAQEQGKFWRMHDLLFEYPKRHDAAGLRALAEQAGLDIGLFDACLRSPRTKVRLKRDLDLGVRLKLRGTPTFFLWGPHLKRTKIPGMITVDLFDTLFKTLDSKLAKQASPSKVDGRTHRAGPRLPSPRGGSRNGPTPTARAGRPAPKAK